MTADEDLVVVDEGHIRVARAVVASVLAAKNHLISQTIPSEGTENRLVLYPFWPWGYPLTGELLALEQMALRSSTTNPSIGASDSQRTGEAQGITNTDELLSESTAFLFDHLVNLVLPGGLLAPSADKAVPANEPYERALRSADFAGSLQVETAAWKGADALLFRLDEKGNRVPTDKYAGYQDFEGKVENARSRLRDAPQTMHEDERIAMQRALERLEVDWLVLGHRREIELAVQTLLREDRANGFEAERTRLLERLESKKTKRLDAIGQSYVQSELIPLMPLLEGPDGSGSWRKVELTNAQVRAALLTEFLEAEGISQKELEVTLKGLERFSFEFLPVDVVREWMDTSFFSARYWRLPRGEVFSDGHGGGAFPGYASALLFVRGLVTEHDAGVTAIPPDGSGDEQSRIRFARIGTTEMQGRMNSAGALELAKSSGLFRTRKLLEARESERRLAKVAVAPALAGLGAVPPVHSETPGISAVNGVVGRTFSAVRARLTRFKPTGQAVLGHRTFQDHVRPSFPVVDVEISGDQAALDGLKAFVMVPGGIGGLLMHKVEIKLRNSSANQLTATQQIPAKRGKGTATAVLRDSRGRDVASKQLDLAENRIQLTWKVARTVLPIGLTSSTVPTLFGYITTLVPPCPNPDPALQWPI